MLILTEQAIKAVSRKLYLPVTGHERDWPVELADPSRIHEFLTTYQFDSTLNQAQRRAVMALLLASCDQALQTGKVIDGYDWRQIQTSLYADRANRDLLDYWALPGVEDVNQHFHLTPYIRSPA